MKLKSLVVDDEYNCRNNLKLLLEEYCPEVEVIALASSAAQARELIEKHQPDVVFLDVKMPEEDGFSLLKSLPERNFSVVFTTAYNEYALKAFKANAVDYIEKPIDIEELRAAVQKLLRFRQQDGGGLNNKTIQDILENVLHAKEVETTAIPTTDGFIVARNDEIIYLEADENYTTIYLTGNRKYLSCGSLSKYEKILNKKIFFRTHRSYIINIPYHLKEFSRKEGNMAILSNSVKVPIARRTVPEFLSQIKTI